MHTHDHEHDQHHDGGNGHAHARPLAHEHTGGHEHVHEHTHEHQHNDGTTHVHEHTHAHAHEHGHDGEADHHSHDSLLKSKAEAAAFLQYTLQHNAHHDEELSGLVHSLRHLSLDGEAAEIEACIGALEKVNARLEAVLVSLK